MALALLSHGDANPMPWLDPASWCMCYLTCKDWKRRLDETMDYRFVHLCRALQLHDAEILLAAIDEKYPLPYNDDADDRILELRIFLKEVSCSRESIKKIKMLPWLHFVRFCSQGSPSWISAAARKALPLLNNCSMAASWTIASEALRRSPVVPGIFSDTKVADYGCLYTPNNAVFSPCGEMVALSYPGSIVRVNTVKGGLVLQATNYVLKNIHSLAWSSDGKDLAVGGSGHIAVWTDVKSGNSFKTQRCKLEQDSLRLTRVTCVAFSPQGKLATGIALGPGGKYVVEILDSGLGIQTSWDICAYHGLDSIEWLPCGNKVVCGGKCRSGKATLYNVESHEALHVFHLQASPVHDVNMLVTTWEDHVAVACLGSCVVYETGVMEPRFCYRGHSFDLKGCTCLKSPVQCKKVDEIARKMNSIRGKRLKNDRVCDIDAIVSNFEEVQVAVGPACIVTAFSRHPDGTRFAMGTLNRRVVVWNTSGQIENVFDIDQYHTVCDTILALQWKGDMLMVFSDLRGITWCDARRQCQVWDRRKIVEGQWSPQGGLFAACDEGGEISVWDPRSGIASHRFRDSNLLPQSLTWGPELLYCINAKIRSKRLSVVTVLHGVTRDQLAVLGSFAIPKASYISASIDGTRLASIHPGCSGVTVWAVPVLAEQSPTQAWHAPLTQWRAKPDSLPEARREMTALQGEECSEVQWSPDGKVITCKLKLKLSKFRRRVAVINLDTGEVKKEGIPLDPDTEVVSSTSKHDFRLRGGIPPHVDVYLKDGEKVDTLYLQGPSSQRPIIWFSGDRFCYVTDHKRTLMFASGNSDRDA